MRDAAIGPRERGAFERPADRDPLSIELQRNRHRRERERRRGDQREPTEVARTGGLHAQQLAEQEGHDEPFGHGNRAGELTEAALQQRRARREEEPRAAGNRREVRIAGVARTPAEHEWIHDERDIQRGRQRERRGPRRRFRMVVVPGGLDPPGRDDGRRRNPVPLAGPGDREDQRDVHHRRKDDDGQRHGRERA